MIQVLCAYGADVGVVSVAGRTALHDAAAVGHAHCCKFLAQRGEEEEEEEEKEEEGQEEEEVEEEGKEVEEREEEEEEREVEKGKEEGQGDHTPLVVPGLGSPQSLCRGHDP